MRKLLYEIYNALSGIVTALTPAEPELEAVMEPLSETRTIRGGKKK